MMDRTILSFDSIGRNDVSLAGGKGANLGDLASHGFPVPPGFIVSALACKSFFHAIGIADAVVSFKEGDPGTLAPSCKQIQRRIETSKIPNGLAHAIVSAHNDLISGRPSVHCAVRSSATAEDLGDASFAGQHATYYYVDGQHLLKMVKHCWASLWNPEAVSYRMNHGIDHGSVFMAVVVQEMIRSDISGVTFTANPVTGSLDDIVTESSWGMGAAIVDGRVTPDHYIFSRNHLHLKEKRIADKRHMVPPRMADGSGPRLCEIPHELRHKETLPSNLARTVTRWALKAEAHFGCPQDVEWAIAEKSYYMLQSRPITIMGREDIGQGVDGQYVIFKPVVENFTDPVTPLTGDFYQMLFAPPVIRFMKGWLYLNLKPFRAILPFKLSNEELTGLLYDFETQQLKLKMSLLKMPLFLGFCFLAYLMFGVFFARTRKLPGNFMDIFRNLAEEIDRNPEFGPVETIKRLLSWSRLFDPAGYQVMMANLSAPRYFPAMDILEYLLKRWLPDLRKDAAALLCSGTEGVLSANMGREIWALAKLARRHSPVHRIIKTHSPENILAALKAEPHAEAFLKKLDAFLARNGHRGLKELELRSPRWEEDPTPVLGMVRNYLLVEMNPGGHDPETRRSRAQLEKEMIKRLKKYRFESFFRPRWRLIRYLGDLAKYYARMRENSRFYHVMGFHVLRKKILRIEQVLMREGRLKCRDDIFFLHLHEIFRMQSGQLNWQDVEDRIRNRRMAHIRFSKSVPPKTIGLPVTEDADRALRDVEGLQEVQGRRASPGKYTGIAHVILDPSVDIELKPGEVLIAPFTDPAWTPLFLTVGAAVVEVGSYLSHAGTVAREFGMPCVVDVPGCTKRIHTGMEVHVDGNRGMVRFSPKSEGDTH